MTLSKILSIATVVLMLLSLGCGMSIKFGGEAFRNAVTGHMVLGILTFVLAIATMIAVFAGK